MKKLLFSTTLLFLVGVIRAQVYDDYIGAGHSLDVQATSSDPSSLPESAVNGAGLDLDIQGSSRFLAHATLGATIEEIERLAEIGFEQWIDEQMAVTPSNYTTTTVEIIYKLLEECEKNLGMECERQFNLTAQMWRYAWWHHVMRSNDLLRQRVSMALSEILVISDQSGLTAYPHGLAYYYDALHRNAFGNFEDLLLEVTLNPSMGFYLSHLNNPRSIPAFNIHPDENYAREIMQLFSIGLYELNNDGSRKVDLTTGQWIPTYTNDEIKELAKVFTGLSGSKWSDPNNPRPVEFGRRFAAYSLVDPMAMYEQWHEPGPKTIVGGYTIPAGQSGMQDVRDAVRHLFNHDNVGPFLSYRLIQRLVKSNPTPQYIDRVASVFNNNGQGVRGDLAAVVKAILLDEEAMECYWLDDYTAGMLREPMFRYTELMRGLKAETQSDYFWNSGFYYQTWTEQHVLSAPSVFNFFPPDYVPNEDFAYDNIVGPEYQILNSSTSSNYVNFMLIGLMRRFIGEAYSVRLPNVLNEPNFIPYINDASAYEAHLSDPSWLNLADAPEELVDYLDILLTNGQLSDETKSGIVASLKQTDVLPVRHAPYYAAFLIMIHPDFVVMK